MTLLERIQKIEEMTAELADLTSELREDIEQAMLEPQQGIPVEVTENEHDTKNHPSEDTGGEARGES